MNSNALPLPAQCARRSQQPPPLRTTATCGDHAGFAAEDNQQLTRRFVGQDSVVTKSEILSSEKSPVSMMPEGLLKTLKDDEVRDLIAYLRTTAQVLLPKP